MANSAKNVIKFTMPLIYKNFGQELGDKILKDYEPVYENLVNENKDDPKPFKSHTDALIFPTIAFYRAMQSNGIDKETAFKILYDAHADRVQGGADAMKSMLKIPGLYKAMPFMWKIVTKKNFGTDAGFKFNFYPTGNDRVKFDMVECTYCKYCKKYGCPEIVPVFCHTDDVNNENLHPKLIWNRTKTMGGGDDLCDFDLIVKK